MPLTESFLDEFLDNRTSIKSVQAASTQADKETGNPSPQFPETLSLSSLVSHLLILNDKVNSFRKDREQSECSFEDLCLLYVLLYRRLLGRLLLPRSEWSQTIFSTVDYSSQSNQGPVAQSFISANRWLRSTSQSIRQATRARWTIRDCSALLWFNSKSYITKPNILPFLSIIFIRGNLELLPIYSLVLAFVLINNTCHLSTTH